ncbi:MAG TPA: MFS transporter [Verrucomicrobiae bacterium]
MNGIRKRDFLLSLKYATIEACFSVPMLNLTRSNLPFVIGFVTAVLKWEPALVGWLASVPLICHVIQPVVTHWLQRFFSLREIVLINFAFNALPWAFISLFPFLGSEIVPLLFVIVFISSLADSVAAVAWSASMSDLVPLSIRGRYFGDRNIIFAFWNLVVLLASGQFVDHFNNTIHAFGAIFATAAGARMIGMYYFAIMKFPASVTKRQEKKTKLAEYLSVIRDLNYLKLLLFIGLWGFCLNLAQPFYSVYVLQHLPYTVGDLTVLATIASLGGLLSLRTWGPLSDRFGNKPVMVACSLLWAASAALSWLLAGPERHGHLYLNYFITGFMTSGFQLCQFNLMINLVPAEKKAAYISVFFAFSNLIIAFGPIVGGKMLSVIPEQVGTLLGEPLTSYHVLFVISMVLCLFSVHMLQALREPAERPLKELVRVMRGMHEFNPVVGFATLAEYMFTPRGVLRLVQSSVRTLKRQTNVVADVGEDLVEGSIRAVKRRASRDSLKGLKPTSKDPNSKE